MVDYCEKCGEACDTRLDPFNVEHLYHPSTQSTECPDNGAPQKFRKKPVVVEAWQWRGDNAYEIMAWINRSKTEEQFNPDVDPVAHVHNFDLKLKTLEGEMTASLGDFVIKGVQGEFYPCRPDIFRATYDVMDEPTPEDFKAAGASAETWTDKLDD